MLNYFFFICMSLLNDVELLIIYLQLNERLIEYPGERTIPRQFVYEILERCLPCLLNTALLCLQIQLLYTRLHILILFRSDVLLTRPIRTPTCHLNFGPLAERHLLPSQQRPSPMRAFFVRPTLARLSTSSSPWASTSPCSPRASSAEIGGPAARAPNLIPSPFYPPPTSQSQTHIMSPPHTTTRTIPAFVNFTPVVPICTRTTHLFPQGYPHRGRERRKNSPRDSRRGVHFIVLISFV